MEKWTLFFLNQCEYEFEDGKLSTLEMLHSIIEIGLQVAFKKIFILNFLGRFE